MRCARGTLDRTTTGARFRVCGLWFRGGDVPEVEEHIVENILIRGGVQDDSGEMP